MRVECPKCKHRFRVPKYPSLLNAYKKSKQRESSDEQ